MRLKRRGHQRLRQQIGRPEKGRIAQSDARANDQHKPEQPRHRAVCAVQPLVPIIGNHGEKPERCLVEHELPVALGL